VHTYQQQALQALGDPTRREIFERLTAGPLAVGELAEELPISRPAVSQHLKVLKEARLVFDRPSGTRRVYQVDPAAGGRRCASTSTRSGATRWRAFALPPRSRSNPPDPGEKHDHSNSSPSRGHGVGATGAGVRRVHAGLQPMVATDAQDRLGRAGRGGVLEGREGGRWYERDVDGSECDWGRVLVWDPPSRLVLAWQISGEWAYDAELLTEVEVLFVSEGPDRTRVELEHRGLDAYGDQMDEVRRSIDSPGGWPGILELFAQAGGLSLDGNWINEPC